MSSSGHVYAGSPSQVFPGPSFCAPILIFTPFWSKFLTHAVLNVLQKLNFSRKSLREYFNAGWVRRITFAINLDIGNLRGKCIDFENFRKNTAYL